MDIENCAVTDDSLSLLEEEIKVLASKPKDFFASFINNQELFKQATEHFQRSEIDVQRIFGSAKTQGVTGKDVSEALRLIKKEAKENASQIPSATMTIIIKDYIATAPVSDEATLPVGYKFIGNCAISVGLHGCYKQKLERWLTLDSVHSFQHQALQQQHWTTYNSVLSFGCP